MTIGALLAQAIERTRFSQYGQEDERSALLMAREREARAEADAARASRDELLAIVSHDLRNPLAVLTMNLAIVERWAPPGEEGDKIRRRIPLMLRAAEQMERLILDLLDTSVIQSRGLSVDRATCDLVEIVREACEILTPRAAQGRVKVEIEMGERPVPIVGERARVGQVVSNLVSNAIKFTPEGGHVTIAATPKGDEVLVSVRDTGPGIPAEHLGKIFDRFWRAPRASAAGTGLGLYISKAIVEGHGGRIWVESKVGAGSTFFFTLPMVRG
jgi:signal transduction histidine kinase